MSTVHLPDDLAERVAAAAKAEGVTPDEFAARVLDERVPARRRLSFTGVGASGSGDLSERYKDLRHEEFGRKSSDDV